MSRNSKLQIDLRIIPDSAAEGANVADWFIGGWLTIKRARRAATPEEADRILSRAYRGPDVDGVEVRWEILD